MCIYIYKLFTWPSVVLHAHPYQCQLEETSSQIQPRHPSQGLGQTLVVLVLSVFGPSIQVGAFPKTKHLYPYIPTDTDQMLCPLLILVVQKETTSPKVVLVPLSAVVGFGNGSTWFYIIDGHGVHEITQLGLHLIR